MRHYYRFNSIILFCVVTISIFASCAPVRIEKVTPHEVHSYKFMLQSAGFMVYIDPYNEEDRIQRFFGCDLLSRGVFPVLVAIVNENADDGYMLLKEQTSLTLRSLPKSIDRIEIEKRTYELDKAAAYKTTEDVAAQVAILLAPISLPVLLPVGLIADKSRKDELEIKRNLEEKQLKDKIIYPGSSQRGFLYFQLSGREDFDKVEGIDLRLKNVRSGEVTSLLIRIDTQRRGR